MGLKSLFNLWLVSGPELALPWPITRKEASRDLAFPGKSPSTLGPLVVSRFLESERQVGWMEPFNHFRLNHQFLCSLFQGSPVVPLIILSSI